MGKTLTHNHSNGVMKKRKDGRKKFTETRHRIYKGVRKRSGKWVCEMRQPDLNKSRLWLGTFGCPEMAAKAYDAAALSLRGESAELNFPEEAKANNSPALNSSMPLLPELARFKEGEVESTRNGYVDEEELFNMPELLDGLAEGLIVTPLAMQKGFNWDDYDNLDNAVELSLWSH